MAHSLAINKGVEWGLRAIKVDKDVAKGIGMGIGIVAGIATLDLIGSAAQIKLHASEHITTKFIESTTEVGIDITT